jgi:non-ribosomal peptide synthetase-like protein
MILRGPQRPDLLRDETLADILKATVASYPNKTALEWHGQTWSYTELLEEAQHLAQGLHDQGTQIGEVLGVWLPRGADLLIGQVAITLSGAAWLPFDAETPIERVQICLTSAKARGILTNRERAGALQKLGITAWAIEDLRALPKRALTLPSAQPTHPAYVIYTSGSTGQPKGIVISHRNICHLLRSENAVIGVKNSDRVYQGFSVAFDMSFEEIWISYLVGATLWIAPPEIVSDPEALTTQIKAQEINVVHAVPTLMALIDDPLPGVRLINLGGEACPEALVGRLARPGRLLFNSYGPTETSVTATLTALQVGEAVSIGIPLPNYGVMVVDDQQRLVPDGEVGELAVFGPGLATGYLGLPELTASKFLPNPHAASPAEDRLYLTGDLAKIVPGGPVYCLGRVDDQVKIRGFRVELGEIEARLAQEPGVGAVAVVLRKISEVDQLVAFLVASAGQTLHVQTLRQALSVTLPSYMVPAVFEVLPELPRLPSGKIDRKKLQPSAQSLTQVAVSTEPRNEDEVALWAALQRLVPGQSLRPEADFFTDLGGHSLLAARLVSLLRQQAAYATLSVGDLYRERTLEKFCAILQQRRTSHQSQKKSVRLPIDRARHFWCGLAQAFCLPFIVLWHMGTWLAPFFTYHFNTGEPGDSVPVAVAWSLLVFILIEISSFLIAIIGKRLLVGNLQPGRYALWSTTYFRFWLSEKLSSLAPIRFFHGTPWLNLYLRLLGAKIGEKVFIDNIIVAVPELLTIEDEADLGSAVIISNARVSQGYLIVGPVRIEKGALVESNTVLENDTVVQNKARLEAMSCLAEGVRIPAGETWAGAPARATQRLTEVLPPRPACSAQRQFFLYVFFAIAAFGIACLFFLPVFPVFMLIDAIDAHFFDIFEEDYGLWASFGFFFLLSIPASALLVFLTTTLTGLLRKLLLPAQVVGRWPIHSGAYLRKWLITRILDASLETLHGLYASVYAATWLRLMGAKVGRHTEVSTATGVIPDLLSLGNDSFVADGVMLGDEEQRGGWMTLKPTVIGDRSFLGNGAYVPDGTVVPNDMLIGVQTRTPPNEAMKSGQVWMGSPALLLPAREGDLGFNATLTFRPTKLRWLSRAFVETLRIVLPMSFVIATGYLIVQETIPYAEEEQWGMMALALSIAGCLYGVSSFVLVLVLKWLCIRKYSPTARPMWSPFVWISEAITNVYESLAVPNFLDFLRGTPMLPWALKLLGVKVGQRTFLDTTDITEFDCVTIGDDCELNYSCGPQTHLFEDRVMKIGNVVIGNRVSVGAASTILYNTEVGDDVQLGSLTLVAKGERLPAQTSWEGSPAAPVA